MTTDVEDFQDMEPSTISETPDVATADQAVADAATSTATDVAQEKDTLSIVRDVVSKTQTPADAAPSADEEDEVEGQGETEKSVEDYADVPFGKHPRFQQLLRERNSFKERAQYSDNIQGFIEENGMTNEEAATALKIAAQSKLDPVGAWEAIKPWVTQLATAAGEILPPDILERVNKQEISLETAKELSKARATAATATAVTSFREQQAQRTQAKSHVETLVETADNWYANRLKKDPNFEAKSSLLREQIIVLQHSEGKPTTVEGVKDQLKRAYAAVNERLPAPTVKTVPTTPAAPAAPRKPAITPVRGGVVSSSSVAPAVNTTLDVIRRVQEKHGIRSTAG